MRRTTNLRTAAVGLLTGAGLAVVAGGPAAQADSATDNSTVNVVVSGAITIDAPALFTITGAPGATAAANGPVVVTTNNATGYTVNVQANVASLTPIGTSQDSIPVGNLIVTASGGTGTPGTPFALAQTPTLMYTKNNASTLAGDAITTNLSIVMPFVTPDTYTGTVTFTATTTP